ncbi:hypothetical protein CPB84DRAFT_1750098 [Gymnopilus junonius]|uniref:ABM domain-containing protein n=1 Tax=Gymnopilus junonius TaxID=109634 RepID=A0A9P5NG54_GYMJU|nr:hypothetical protein CPB84DRAFT_1750098 [Gymnopilus junonius]
MPVVEIAWWTPSEAFDADKSIINPALDFTKSVDGCNAVYSGFAEEENTFFLFLVWETLEHHKKLMAHPEYPKITRLLPTIGAGGINVYHVEFNKDFTPAVGQDQEELYETLSANGSLIEEVLPEEHRPAVYGQTVEDPTKFYGSIGWKSTAFHGEVVQQPQILAQVMKIREVVDYKLLHVNFKKH